MKKTKKEKTASWYKNECWRLFSLIIRISAADFQGREKCCTCDTYDFWQKMQAGHFVDGRNNTVLLDKKLVHPQCWKCNIILHGNKIQYTLFMKRTYGYTDEEIEELDKKKNAIKQMFLKDWREKYLELKEIYNSLINK